MKREKLKHYTKYYVLILVGVHRNGDNEMV